MKLLQIIIACLIFASLALAAAPATAPVTGDSVLAYLDQTIDWYRRVSALAETPVNSEELVLRETVRSDAKQVVHFGFDFARAEAQVLNSDPNKNAPAASDKAKNLAQS